MQVPRSLDTEMSEESPLRSASQLPWRSFAELARQKESKVLEGPSTNSVDSLLDAKEAFNYYNKILDEHLGGDAVPEAMFQRGGGYKGTHDPNRINSLYSYPPSANLAGSSSSSSSCRDRSVSSRATSMMGRFSAMARLAMAAAAR